DELHQLLRLEAQYDRLIGVIGRVVRVGADEGRNQAQHDQQAGCETDATGETACVHSWRPYLNWRWRSLARSATKGLHRPWLALRASKHRPTRRAFRIRLLVRCRLVAHRLDPL